MDQPPLRAPTAPQTSRAMGGTAAASTAFNGFLSSFFEKVSTATASIELPAALANLDVGHHAPTLAGALFAAGWAAQADAAITFSGPHSAHEKLPFVRYLPGILSTLAMLLMATVRRADIDNYASAAGGGDYSDGVVCRARGALFVAYCLSFAALATAATGLLTSGGGWVGAAGVLNCLFVLSSGLVLFVKGGGDDGGGDFGYSGF